MITRNLGETDAHYFARLADVRQRRDKPTVDRALALLAADSLDGARSALAVLTAAAGQPATRAKAVATR